MFCLGFFYSIFHFKIENLEILFVFFIKMAFRSVSPEVPHGYGLHNTYESEYDLDTVRASTEIALKSLGVVTISPDGLLYICKALYDHRIFNFWVILFHSQKGEFVELRGGKHSDFVMIEEEFAKRAGFTPSKGNFKHYVLPFPFPEHLLDENHISIVIEPIEDDIEKATFYTEDNASYRELLLGISLCIKIFKTTKPDILTKRLIKFALFDQEADLRCLALDALDNTNVAEHLATDSDALVRRTANIILGF